MISMLFLLLQAAPAAPAAPTAAWAPQTKVNANGSTSVSARAASTDGKARLVVRCDHVGDAVVSVQLLPTTSFGATDPRVVSLTADGGAPVTADWEFPGAAFNRDSTTVTALTVAIAKAKKIKVTTTNAANVPFSAEFSGPGSDAPIRQVVEACGYVFGQVPAPVAPPAAAAAPQ